VLDLRIPAPSCDCQKPHHDRFQVLTPLRRQPICRGCRTSGDHVILDPPLCWPPPFFGSPSMRDSTNAIVKFQWGPTAEPLALLLCRARAMSSG
jgi:hypothetical protein